MTSSDGGAVLEGVEPMLVFPRALADTRKAFRSHPVWGAPHRPLKAQRLSRNCTDSTEEEEEDLGVQRYVPGTDGSRSPRKGQHYNWEARHIS